MNPILVNVWIALFLIVIPSGLVKAADSCSVLIPSGARQAITTAYPQYLLPTEADNLEELVKLNREEGGTGCFGVATGKFRGDLKDAVAVLLHKKKGNTLLVVAFPVGDIWKTELLRDWGAGERNYLYVNFVGPGTYKRFDELEGPVSEPGEKLTFTSKSPGLVTGRIESSGVAYFFTGKKWVHVWISD
jgi:hypothetical protein